MGQVFISFYREDADEATALALGLEGAGYTTWSYTRKSRPGRSYLDEIADAIAACEVMVVIASRQGTQSEQMTSEILQAFEQRKHFVPVLMGLKHGELRRDWRAMFRGAISIEIPEEGVSGILLSIVDGLRALGVVPHVKSAAPSAPAAPRPRPGAGRPQQQPPAPPPKVNLVARFDHTSYARGEDPLAYWLAELEVEPAVAAGASEEARPGADVALVLDVSGSMQAPNRYPLLREAVRQFVSGLGTQDRVSVTLFTERAQTVVPFMAGDRAAADPDQIVRAMDQSGMLFGPDTLLAPGLRLALDAYTGLGPSTGRVRRAYVLTDGELSDVAECKTALYGFRPQSAEVHVYGFGEDFDAAALKRLVSDQIGGTVKPIVNEEDITRTFAHMAAVNRRLIGQDGKLTVTLSPEAVCGDAWVYQPHGRYLGPIKGRRVEHTFGGIEAGRKYSLLLEVRLPLTDGSVATVEAEWLTGGQVQTRRTDVTAPRGRTGQPVADVRRAVDVVNVLRAENDKGAQLASYKARRELAEIENRDPELLAALDKLIAGMTNPAAGTVPPVPDDSAGTWVAEPAPEPAQSAGPGRFAPQGLTAREKQLLESDERTCESRGASTVHGGQLEDDLLGEVNQLLGSGEPAVEAAEKVFSLLTRYVGRGLEESRAVDLWFQFEYQFDLPRRRNTGDVILAFHVAAKERTSGAT